MTKPPSIGNIFLSDIGDKTPPARAVEPPPITSAATQDASPWQNQRTEKQVYQVSELNQSVGQLLASQFPLIWLEGEVSNLSKPQSGHCYFSLKDEIAQVRCALFRQTAMRTDAQALKVGAKVLVRAKVGLYEPRGDFQLIIQSVEDAGIGQLQRAYDALLKKLQAEGLLTTERKQSLPTSISHVGLITSQTGAAVHDVISTIRRRNPSIAMTLYPSMVQGEGAARTLRESLALAVEHGKADVILLVRGGGSLEDLWAFNDEALARAIADCPIPTVSGVGHEVDVTICDWVADVRAPTPTGAAELVAADSSAQRERFAQLTRSIARLQRRYLGAAQQQTSYLGKRLSLAHPLRQLQQHSQRVDELASRLQSAQSRRLSAEKSKASQLDHRLQQLAPTRQLTAQRQRCRALADRQTHAISRHLAHSHQRAAALAAQLHAISPLQTLARGYAIVQQSDRRVVTSHIDVVPGEALSVRLNDGSLSVTVDQAHPDSG